MNKGANDLRRRPFLIFFILAPCAGEGESTRHLEGCRLIVLKEGVDGFRIVHAELRFEA